MTDNEQQGTVIELLLREPEILAWLDDYRPQPEDGDEDDEPPRAA